MTDRALRRLNELLDLHPAKGTDDYPVELRTLLGAVKTTLETQLKADENALRRETVDMLPQILAAITQAERKLPGRVIDAVTE